MANYDNLDPQDKAICEALEAGKTDEAIMSEFGVDEAKLAQLKPVVAEKNPPAGNDQPQTNPGQ